MSDPLAVIDDNLRVISKNVGIVNDNLTLVAQGLARVDGKVEEVSVAVTTTRSELTQLADEFRQFVQVDAKAKALQLAETRLVKVKQELDTTFGYYAEVRRLTVGILQAADVSIVRQETIKLASEELMLKAPRYWLAPGLVAVSSWLSDNRPLAERAMMEAVSRDDNKASLYFALIARRGGRRAASGAWLQRFFSLTRPCGSGPRTGCLD